ncbi:hypothetical protein TanjilG_16849 [Lupinus angustifolius]|uniref:Uncharacterized protein n=1 Tax=Lupinus angustifolius TaxID=3871 RepID=A0A394D8B8_LUPAN|nr:PREDICTED: uncharacterized protein LOC109337269 [Lupinus angustifolius]XP_019429753.1 PREDICTED: uncharacterized protein LOC109337269 [Lupinus angustifolius]OIW19384.1 hypothetical protein TanjilG_16849 [Lupinus angustifolius]
MLPLKLIRSLVLGETIYNNPSHLLTQNHHHHHHDSNDDDNEVEVANEIEHHHHHSNSKTPAILFLPTKEIIIDTYKLATIARHLGFDLHPTPSLSHIIFSNPTSSKSTSTSSSSSSTTTPSTSSFSSSYSPSLLNDAIPIPFPSLSTAPLTHLRFLVNLAPRAFKLVFFNHRAAAASHGTIWDCCALSLYSRVSGNRIDSMEGFCQALAGKGWIFYKSKKKPSVNWRHSGGGGGEVYLFRKVDVNRVWVGRVNRVEGPDGACRMRELRLPHLDFGNAPLRILQYILLMTDDIFFLA